MKNIISIISDQLIPNYIFIKEIAKQNDNLIFISTRRMEAKLKTLKDILSGSNFNYSELIFDNDGDENDYTNMYKQIEDKIKNVLAPSSEVIANLTGGTKLMSITLKEILDKSYPKSKYYYIPLPENKIIPLEKEKSIENINYRVSIKEYLKAYEINKFSISEPIENEEFTKTFFYKFKNLKGIHYEIIDKLREYRNDRRKTPYTINEIINGISSKPPIPNIKDLLDFIKFPLKDEEKISCQEISYLTGGWFEEYAYYLIKTNLKPNDIEINLRISATNNTNMNELDVVFTLGNKLFIIECKTGIAKQKDLNDIVYKATALKDGILGKLGANSYIFSLKKEDPNFTKIAKNMKIKYCSEEYFHSEEKQQVLFEEIRKKANN